MTAMNAYLFINAQSAAYGNLFECSTHGKHGHDVVFSSMSYENAVGVMDNGPRVADISPAIYHRYFEFAGYLERRAKGHPNFQYIITTTEPPPERFVAEPYLCLKLDASRPEDRFLKCNL